VRRWVRDARLDWITGSLLVVFAALRLVATLDRPIAFFPDSPSYFTFELWGGVRFPVVTALYATIGDHRAIVTVQAVAGVLAWSVAVVVAGSVIVPRWVRYGFQGAVLTLGLTLPVTRFDNALLSESIAISLTVVFVACVLRFVCCPTARMAMVVFALAVVWGLTRQNNALMLAIAAVVIAVVGAGRANRRVAWRLAVGFLAIAFVGVLLASSTSQIQQYNTAQIFVRRVLPDADRSQWFEVRGMPSNGRSVLVPPYPDGIGDPAVALQHDPTFGPWLEDHGPRTYLRFLATHPGFVITTPFSDDGALNAIAVGITVYGSSRQVVPDLVETVLWPQTGGDQTPLVVLVLGILAVAVVVAVRSPSRRGALAGAGGVLVTAVGNVVLVTHSAGWEYERLLVPTSVAVRIAILWMLAVLVGDVRVAGAGTPAVSAVPASGSPDPAPERPDAANSAPAADPGRRTSPARGEPDSSGASAADPSPGRPGTT
jgi:hypothetical protein